MARFTRIAKDETPVLGKRGQELRSFVAGLLAKGDMKQKYIQILTDDASMNVYTQVFTHVSMDSTNNYERFEILGDATCNKFLIWYFSRRFPHLFSTSGVRVLAELKIRHGSKIVFAPIARELGFLPFISAIKGEFDVSETSLCEDVFEAFIGATEYLLDLRVREGVGYAVAYNILKTIFATREIDTSYQALHPPISRLKEIFDRREVVEQFGCDRAAKKKFEYTTTQSFDRTLYTSVISTSPRGLIIGSGTGQSKVGAENAAAADALATLRAKWSVSDDDKAKAYEASFV